MRRRWMLVLLAASSVACGSDSPAAPKAALGVTIAATPATVVGQLIGTEYRCQFGFSATAVNGSPGDSALWTSGTVAYPYVMTNGATQTFVVTDIYLRSWFGADL